MSSKPFASSTDLVAKEATLEQLADGVFAYTAQGDPNVGCIVGTDALLAIEARATPYVAQQWIDVIRDRVSGGLPFGDLVLTHSRSAPAPSGHEGSWRTRTRRP